MLVRLNGKYISSWRKHDAAFLNDGIVGLPGIIPQAAHGLFWKIVEYELFF